MIMVQLRKPVAGLKAGRLVHATPEELTALGLDRQDYQVVGTCINDERSDLAGLIGQSTNATSTGK